MTTLLDMDDATLPIAIDALLAQYGSLRKVVASTGDDYTAVYSRIRGLGYRIAGRLVPIHAPEINNNQAA